MSGGSFNYLCYKERSDFQDREVQDEAVNMGYTLECMGYMQAALDTHAVVAYVKMLSDTDARLVDDSLSGHQGFALKPLDTVLSLLHHLWRAVEWNRSGDWGPEQVTAAHDTYLATRPTPMAGDAMVAMSEDGDINLAEGFFPVLVQTPDVVAEEMRTCFQFADVARMVERSTPEQAATLLRERADASAAATGFSNAVFWFHGWANRLGQGITDTDFTRS